MSNVVVVGAGIGGLTTAAILAKSGMDVTVLEAHIYAGGCAGTFFHKGYRFDAGATLAGGFDADGPMGIVARAVGIESWPARPTQQAMRVSLPDGSFVDRFGDERRWLARAEAFGGESEAFWRWQEQTADAMWSLALQTPPWPPQTIQSALKLAQTGTAWLLSQPAQRSPTLLADALRSVSRHLPAANERLRMFVDGQLLIAAQTTSGRASALYGAAALDLPRRGIVHLEGGIGAIAETLVRAVERSGGRVLFRQEVTRISRQAERSVVETKRGDRFPADIVVANLPPWNIARLLGTAAPRKLQRLSPQPPVGWGAFMVYAGVDTALFERQGPLHQQVLLREPFGEGNSLFLSLSPEWDASRAPSGHRALTISTHTDFRPWWQLFASDRLAYEDRKKAYAGRILEAAERALPGLREAAEVVLPGTPVTFQRFTRRQWGWVGGFPQTSLFQGWGPRLAPGLWMVGDSVFPGQSTAAVALGALRVAADILADASAFDVQGMPELTENVLLDRSRA